MDGYTGTGYAPALGAESGTVGYKVIHNIIRAHGKAYRLYEKTYKSTQNGKGSILFFALFNLWKFGYNNSFNKLVSQTVFGSVLLNIIYAFH